MLNQLWITGMLVEVGAIDKLAETVLEVIQDRHLQKTLTENASQSLLEKFNIVKNMRHHEDEYKKMAVYRKTVETGI